jgi:hypothetical protein
MSIFELMSKFTTYFNRGLMCLFALLIFSNVTFGFSVNIHQCQGDFYSVALFGNKASCDKMAADNADKEIASCCDKKKPVKGVYFSSKSCCNNESFIQNDVLEANSDFSLSPSTVQIDFIAQELRVESTHSCELSTEYGNVIPPPPLLPFEHDAALLQVFQI